MRWWYARPPKDIAVFFDGDRMHVAQRTASKQAPIRMVYECIDLDAGPASGDEPPSLGWSLLDRSDCSLVLPGHEVFTFMVETPTTDPDEIARMMAFEVKRRLPLDEGQLILSHCILAKNAGDSGPSSMVLLVAAPEETVESRVKRLAAYGIRVTAVAPSFVWLYNAYLAQRSDGAVEDGALIVDVHRAFIDILATQRGQLVLRRSVAVQPLDGNPNATAETVEREFARSCQHLKDNGIPVPLAVFVAGGSPDEVVAAIARSGACRVERLEADSPDERPIPCCLASAAFNAHSRETIHMDLLPARDRRRRESVRKVRAALTLAASLFVLVGLLTAVNDVFFWKEQEYLRFLRESTSQLGPHAEELSGLMDQINASRKAVEAQYRLVGLLDGVATQASQELGIDYLSVEPDGLVRLGGQTSTRSALFEFMARLEESPLVHDVKVTAMPLREMSSTEVVDYQLEMKAGEGK